MDHSILQMIDYFQLDSFKFHDIFLEYLDIWIQMSTNMLHIFQLFIKGCFGNQFASVGFIVLNETPSSSRFLDFESDAVFDFVTFALIRWTGK